MARKTKQQQEDSVSRAPSTVVVPKRDNANTSSSFLLYAFLAGASAAASGICTKLGVSAAAKILVTYLLLIFRFAVYGMDAGNQENNANFETIVEGGVRVVMIASNGIFTAQMWRYLIKAMSLGPTAVAHGVVTATNLAVSALVGVFLLGEDMPGKIWVAGGCIAAVGLVLLIDDDEHQQTDSSNEKKKFK